MAMDCRCKYPSPSHYNCEYTDTFFPTALHRLSDIYNLPCGWRSRWHEFGQPIYLQGMLSCLLHELSFCSPLFHSFG